MINLPTSQISTQKLKTSPIILITYLLHPHLHPNHFLPRIHLNRLSVIFLISVIFLRHTLIKEEPSISPVDFQAVEEANCGFAFIQRCLVFADAEVYSLDFWFSGEEVFEVFWFFFHRVVGRYALLTITAPKHKLLQQKRVCTFIPSNPMPVKLFIFIRVQFLHKVLWVRLNVFGGLCALHRGLDSDFLSEGQVWFSDHHGNYSARLLVPEVRYGKEEVIRVEEKRRI